MSHPSRPDYAAPVATNRRTRKMRTATRLMGALFFFGPASAWAPSAVALDHQPGPDPYEDIRALPVRLMMPSKTGLWISRRHASHQDLRDHHRAGEEDQAPQARHSPSGVCPVRRIGGRLRKPGKAVIFSGPGLHRGYRLVPCWLWDRERVRGGPGLLSRPAGSRSNQARALRRKGLSG